MERERTRIFCVQSHDLRTPLSGIMGTSEMLMDMTDKEDRRQELLQRYLSGRRLAEIISGKYIKPQPRYQDGKIVIQKKWKAIGRGWLTVQLLICGTELSGGDTGRDTGRVPASADGCKADWAGNYQSYWTNAVETHKTTQEAITVSASYTEDELLVSVRDEGGGIAEPDVSIHLKYFTLPKTRSVDVKRGIGLGAYDLWDGGKCPMAERSSGGTGRIERSRVYLYITSHGRRKKNCLKKKYWPGRRYVMEKVYQVSVLAFPDLDFWYCFFYRCSRNSPPI